jgi:hypothetical protein
LKNRGFLRISLPGFKKAKRPEAIGFEPWNQTRYYYGRMWGLLVRVLSEQVGVLPTKPMA